MNIHVFQFIGKNHKDNQIRCKGLPPHLAGIVCLVFTTGQIIRLRLQLHGAIYRPDSFVLMLRYCANLKSIRYESTSLNRIVADKSHRVILALLKY